MYKNNKREKSIEFWAQPKLRLLNKNWSFYTKKILYVIKSNISLATTMLLKNYYWLNKL